jgi:hypothetical protein
MPKPNETMTLKEIRQYVRDKKLNHPEVRLGMKRAELIAGLKKVGHWDDSKKKLDKGQKSSVAGIDDGKKKSKAKPDVPKNTIVIKLENYGRGVKTSDLSGWKELSYQQVFGAKAKKQPGNLGKRFFLKEITTQAGRNQLKQLSEGYPKDIDFFSISSLNKKFGLMGEKSISHSSIRRGDY